MYRKFHENFSAYARKKIKHQAWFITSEILRIVLQINILM